MDFKNKIEVSKLEYGTTFNKPCNTELEAIVITQMNIYFELLLEEELLNEKKLEFHNNLLKYILDACNQKDSEIRLSKCIDIVEYLCEKHIKEKKYVKAVFWLLGIVMTVY